MVKVKVVEPFTLAKFNELKNIVRARSGKEGELEVGDIFECSEDMAKYLAESNKYGKAYVQVIEVTPELVKKTTKKTTKKTEKK